MTLRPPAVAAPDAASLADRGAAPYASHAELVAAFGEHVHPGKVRTFAARGVDVVMGQREGPRFQDVVSGRWLWNCTATVGYATSATATRP
jgi:hypothetical protein